MGNEYPQTPLRRWFDSVADWPDAVLPDYDGGSITNLPATILNALAVPTRVPTPEMAPPLRDDVFPSGFLNEARVVIMLVVDGFGLHAFRAAQTQGALTYLTTAQHSSAITSVFPSTTAAALTTLQTGLAPAQHGMAGYAMYLETQQATVNVITWKASGGMRIAAPLPEAKRFLGVPTIYERLQSTGIEATVVSNLAFADSALTNVQSSGVPYSGHRTPAELAGLLLDATSKSERRFVYGYWDGIDALAHTYGPDSDICLNEIYLLDQALGRGLFEPLSNGSGDVALLLVADHGHAPIDLEHVHSLKSVMGRYSSHRPIPTGDRRATGLAFDDPDALLRLRSIAGDDGVILPVNEALEHGLYGPVPEQNSLRDRIGKTLLLARNDAAFVYPQSNNPTNGGHGSLTEREMLVPLLGWRF